MAQELKLQYSGAIHHLMNRGDRREPVFVDDRERRLLLAPFSEAGEKTEWQIHAWCLTPINGLWPNN
jgi:hypothetical protein